MRIRLCQASEVLLIDDGQLAVALALEEIPPAAALERGPESRSRDTLGYQLAKEAVERADEILRPVQSAEDIAAEWLSENNLD